MEPSAGSTIPCCVVPLRGRYTSLLPLDHLHSPALFRNMGGEANSDIWKHIPDPGMPTQASCDKRVINWVDNPAWHPFAILTGPDSDGDVEPAGMMAFLSVEPHPMNVELGCVMGPRLQRTRASTEAFFLVLRHAFEVAGFRRVEWKTDTTNVASIKAAERVGFVSEVVMKNQEVAPGVFRDSAWFGTERERWPVLKKGFETWLDENNFDAEGRQIRTLRECREELS